MATDNKRILFRRGNYSDLVATDLLPGEPVMALDKNAPGVKGSGGTVVWCATREGEDNVVPMSQGGLGASDPPGALANLGLVTSVVGSGTNWVLSRYGNIMSLRLYNASASGISNIISSLRPPTINATGFAWILGDSPQPGTIAVSAYDGSIKTYAYSGTDMSSTESRASISWLI